jgi:hypothetical protein
MKFATSVLMVAATAGLALLALGTRKQAEEVGTVETVDQTATGQEAQEDRSRTDEWFV